MKKDHGKTLRENSPLSAGMSHFWDGEEEAPLIESGANALIAFKS